MVAAATIEATKAGRAKLAEEYAAVAAEQASLLERLLPPPPADAEPVDPKAKGKKK